MPARCAGRPRDEQDAPQHGQCQGQPLWGSPAGSRSPEQGKKLDPQKKDKRRISLVVPKAGGKGKQISSFLADRASGSPSRGVSIPSRARSRGKLCVGWDGNDSARSEFAKLEGAVGEVGDASQVIDSQGTCVVFRSDFATSPLYRPPVAHAPGSPHPLCSAHRRAAKPTPFTTT